MVKILIRREKMIYKAKDGNLYRVRTAKPEDMLQIVRVHSVSARKTYEPFKEEYPNLYNAFSPSSLTESWKDYFNKCEQNNGYLGIVVERVYGHGEEVHNKVVGISKAGMLNQQYKEHLEEVRGQHLSSEDVKKYANLQTIYIDPKYQGLGLGKAVMGYFANHFSKKGCQYAITETLGGYKESPKFFNKVGGAECLGDYSENAVQAVSNSSSSVDENIPLKLWLMPSIDKMKIPCYFAEKKKQQIVGFYTKNVIGKGLGCAL